MKPKDDKKGIVIKNKDVRMKKTLEFTNFNLEQMNNTENEYGSVKGPLSPQVNQMSKVLSKEYKMPNSSLMTP